VGDEFRVNSKAWNPGIARFANLYVWVTGPDFKSYYMPDWGEMKHPWLYDLPIPAGFSFGPATIFETTLPDYDFPVWQPGQYQVCAELVDAGTGDPLGPAAMTGFGVKLGLVSVFEGNTNYALDVAIVDGDVWTATSGGAARMLWAIYSWRHVWATG
jgi:hypothetical protein